MTARGRILSLILLAGCSRKPAELPVMNPIPPFTLTSQDGAEFRSGDQLGGRVWVANFIFTTCTGPCPRMTSQMKQVQEGTREWDDVKLVSFTVDPENDTPAALAAYARRFDAQPGRWWFLTGARETLHDLSRQAFLLGDVDGTMNHSTRFVLIDRRGRVRKYYGSSEAGSIPQLVADIRELRKETD